VDGRVRGHDEKWGSWPRNCSAETAVDGVIRAGTHSQRDTSSCPGQQWPTTRQSPLCEGDGHSRKKWLGVYWPKWSDALIEAGFQPNSPTEKVSDDVILEKLAIAFQRLGRIASLMELRIYRRTYPDLPTDKTISNRFGSQANLLHCVAKWTSARSEFADIAAMLTEHLPAPQRQSVATAKEGLVYLLRSGANYKIGRSDEIERRIKEIRTAMPDPAILVHSIRTDDPPGIEAYWHRRFADRRANGEWFKLTPSDVAAFTRRTFQ
jgi:hypothetical protein